MTKFKLDENLGIKYNIFQSFFLNINAKNVKKLNIEFFKIIYLLCSKALNYLEYNKLTHDMT